MVILPCAGGTKTNIIIVKNPKPLDGAIPDDQAVLDYGTLDLTIISSM